MRNKMTPPDKVSTCFDHLALQPAVVIGDLHVELAALLVVKALAIVQVEGALGHALPVRRNHQSDRIVVHERRASPDPLPLGQNTPSPLEHWHLEARIASSSCMYVSCLNLKVN